MSGAASRNAHRQRGSEMQRALRPQDEISKRIIRNHHESNVQQLREAEQTHKQRRQDSQSRPAFKMKRFQHVASRLHDEVHQDSRTGLPSVQDQVPKRKLGHVPPYLRKIRAQEKLQKAERSDDEAPEGFRLLGEDQRTSILATLQTKFTGLQKEMEKRFPAHRHVSRTQAKAQEDLVQQIGEVKAMQKKFSMKKVWIEIEHFGEASQSNIHDVQSASDLDFVDGASEALLQDDDLQTDDAAEICSEEHYDYPTENKFCGGLDTHVDGKQLPVEIQNLHGIRETSSSPELDGLEFIEMPKDLDDRSRRAVHHKAHQYGQPPWATDDDLRSQKQNPISGRTYGNRGSRFASSIQFG